MKNASNPTSSRLVPAVSDSFVKQQRKMMWSIVLILWMCVQLCGRVQAGDPSFQDGRVLVEGSNSTSSSPTTSRAPSVSSAPSLRPSMAPSICIQELVINTTDVNGTVNGTAMISQPCTASPTESPISLSFSLRPVVIEGLVFQITRVDENENDGEEPEGFPLELFMNVTKQYILDYFVASDLIKDSLRITNVQMQVKRVEQTAGGETATPTTTFTILWDLILTYIGDFSSLSSKGIVSPEDLAELPFLTEADRALYLETLLNATGFGTLSEISPALTGITLAPSSMPSAMPTMRSGAIALKCNPIGVWTLLTSCAGGILVMKAMMMD